MAYIDENNKLNTESQEGSRIVKDIVGNNAFPGATDYDSIIKHLMEQANQKGFSEEVPPSQEGYSDETGTYDEYGNVQDYYKGMSPTQNVAEPSGERSNELLEEHLNRMKLEQLMKAMQESQTPQGPINQEIRKSDALNK